MKGNKVPAHGKAREAVELATVVHSEEVPILGVDAQSVVAVLEIEGQHPVVVAGQMAESLQGLELQAPSLAVGVELP